MRSYSFESNHAAGELSAEIGVEACLHEELAREGFAFKAAAAVGATEFAELVGGVGVKTCHVPTGGIQADVVLELVAEEHSFGFVFLHEHLATETLVFVGREQAIEVAQLNDGAYLLVEGNGFLGIFALLVVEVAGLHLHTQTSGHRHIEAEFQRNDTTRLVVGRGADVLRHSHDGEFFWSDAECALIR